MKKINLTDAPEFFRGACKPFVRMNQQLLDFYSVTENWKIRAACAMLEANKMTLTEIALECGFNSSSYFCKVFKKEIGISPKAYRAGSLENGSGSMARI